MATFGRIPKLMKLFGMMDDLPRSATLSGVGHDANLGNNNVGQSTYGNYQSQLALSQDYEQKQRDYADMIQYDLIASALEIYQEEAVSTDIMYPDPMWIESSDKEIQKNLESLFNRLNTIEILGSQAWHVAAYGNQFEKIEYNYDVGIVSSSHCDIEHIKRHWDQYRNLLGFSYSEGQPDNPQFRHRADFSGLKTSENNEELWQPWDFVHSRKLSKNRSTEYGDGLIEPARQIYKKLKMAEDAMITHRMDIMPSRILMEIDTGQSDAVTQRKIMNDWRRHIRSNLHIDKNTNEFEKRYDPWAMDNIIFFPKKAGSNTAITKLDGDSDVPDITDVEFLTKKLCGVLRIPPAYLGFEGDVNAKATLIQESVRFARVIRSLRAPIIAGWTRMCEIHLAMQNIDPDEVDFQIYMPPISAVDEEMRAGIISTQIDIVDALAGIGDAFGLDRRQWGSYIFKEYMHLPDDLVDSFMLSSNIGDETVESTLIAQVDPKSVASLNESSGKRNGKESMSHTLDEVVANNYGVRKMMLRVKKSLQGRVGFPLTYQRSEPLPESLSEVDDQVEDITES